MYLLTSLALGNSATIKSAKCSKARMYLIIHLFVCPVATSCNTSLHYGMKIQASLVIELLFMVLRIPISSFLIRLHADISTPMFEVFSVIVKHERCNTMLLSIIDTRISGQTKVLQGHRKQISTYTAKKATPIDMPILQHSSNKRSTQCLDVISVTTAIV